MLDITPGGSPGGSPARLQEPGMALQRMRGRARVTIGARGLVGLHQSGSARAMLPRMHANPPEVVFLNTAGGITGGDRLDFALDVGPGARVTGTTQTAERAYASTGPAGQVDIVLDVGAGARLDWLPQETILFEDCHLVRRTAANLACDAQLLYVETLILGRQAMGETLARARLVDRRIVRRAGIPVLIEPLAIAPSQLAAQSVAGLHSARALATVAFVAPGAEDAVTPLRQIVGDLGAVSGWDGKCILRASARDAFALRRRICAILERLRGGPLPRVWQV